MEINKPSVVTQELQTLVSSSPAGSTIVQTITSAIGSGIVTTDNIRLRASYSGTQAARVLLPVAATKKLMETRKLRIRWVNCRSGYVKQ